MAGSQTEAKRPKGSLNRCLGGIFALFIAATLAVGLPSLNSARHLWRNSQIIKLEAVYESHIEDILGGLNLARSLPSREQRQKAFEALGETRRTVQQEMELVKGEGRHAQRERLLSSGQGIINSIVALESAIREDSGGILGQGEEELARARQLIRQGHDLIYQGLLAVLEDSSWHMTLIMILFLLFLPVSLGFVLVFCLFVGRYLVAPIKRLSQATARIAEGHYQERVPALARTELAELSHHFNVMTLKLQQREEKLKSSQEKLSKKAQETMALYSLSTKILSLLNLEDILSSVVTEGRQLLEADVAVLCLADESQRLLPRAFSGPAEALMEPGSVCSLHEAAPDMPCCCIKEGYHQAWLAAPLKEGYLLVGRSQAQSFTEEDQEVLQGLALAAAIALKNARLYEEVQSLAVTVERQRISQEMHDSLAQRLALLQMKIKGLTEKTEILTPEELRENLQQMEPEIRQAYDELRLTMAGLRTIIPKDGELLAALREYIGEFTQKTGIAVELEVADGVAADLNHATRAELIRILQEALFNVWKHSGASQASLTFRRQDGMAVVTLADQGKGFDLEKVQHEARNPLGLKSMKERAQAVGGRLEIITSPGLGTRVVVQLPLATRRGNS